VKFSPETKYFRVPMETVHVILVVSGPSAALDLRRARGYEASFPGPARAGTGLVTVCRRLAAGGWICDNA